MKYCPFSIHLFLIALFLSCGGSDSLTQQKTNAQSSAKLEKNSSPASASDLLVAEWTGGKVYLSQIDQIIAMRIHQMMQVNKDPSLVKKMIEKERRSALDTLTENYLLLQEAQNRNLAISPVEQERYLREFRENFNTEEEYNDRLQQAGQTEEDLIRTLSTVKLGPKCIEDQVEKIQAGMTEEVMKDYYDKNIQLFSPPARWEINQVVIKSNDNRSMDEAKALAERLRREVKEKIDSLQTFPEKRKVIQECAIKYSDTPDAQYNYGYVIIYDHEMFKEKYSKEFFEELAKVKIGELSGLVPFEDGFAFFLVKEQVPASVHTYDSDLIQSTLPKKYLKDKLDEFKENLKVKYNLHIYEENLFYQASEELPFSEIKSSTSPDF